MNYRAIAEAIYAQLGGKDNLVSAAHCATRLRLVLADNKKCHSEAIEEIDGVKGVFEASGQIQIILGTGVVNKVYQEFTEVSGINAASKEDVKAAAAAKQNLFQRSIKTIGDIFVPIIPAIVASGFLMGIMEALNFMAKSKLIAIDTSSSLFVFASLFANTAYVFLPILIAFSAAKVFGGNPFLGAVVGMIMIHPELQNAWTVASEGVLKTQSVWFGLYQIDMVGYQGHVIPVVLAVWVMSKIEIRLHKIVPAMFDLFVTPLTSVFVTGYLTLSIIGPIFGVTESSIISGIQSLIELPFGIGSFIMGAFYSATVVAGIHHMYTVIDLGQLSMYGFTFWLPLASAANIAQGGAALAVGLKTKDLKLKSVALPASLSCFMGITEPAIFGVNLRFFKPFLCGAAGGAVGALYVSLMHLGATGTGVTGIFGLLLCLHDPINYIIMFILAAGVSFTLTWLFGYKDGDSNKPKKDQGSIADSAESTDPSAPATIINTATTATATATATTATAMKATNTEANSTASHTDTLKTSVTATKTSTEASGFQPETGVISAPVAGTAVAYTEIPDPIFAAGVLGKGVGIYPSSNVVLAPFSGEIVSVTKTQHAVGIKSAEGIEVLIHVGVDTVKMQGDGFTCHVAKGDLVQAGAKLVSFDSEKIKAAGYSDCVAVLVTNSDDYENIEFTTGTCTELSRLIHV